MEAAANHTIYSCTQSKFQLLAPSPATTQTPRHATSQIKARAHLNNPMIKSLLVSNSDMTTNTKQAIMITLFSTKKEKSVMILEEKKEQQKTKKNSLITDLKFYLFPNEVRDIRHGFGRQSTFRGFHWNLKVKSSYDCFRLKDSLIRAPVRKRCASITNVYKCVHFLLKRNFAIAVFELYEIKLKISLST